MSNQKSDQDRFVREMRLQDEAERTERGQAPAGGDPRVDRYRLIVRALRQPLEPQLPDDFATRVEAMALQGEEKGFEEVMLALLLLVMGIVALLFIGPALAKSVQMVVSISLPALPWNQLVMAAIGIGLVWGIERGWVRLHPAAPNR